MDKSLEQSLWERLECVFYNVAAEYHDDTLEESIPILVSFTLNKFFNLNHNKKDLYRLLKSVIELQYSLCKDDYSQETVLREDDV